MPLVGFRGGQRSRCHLHDERLRIPADLGFGVVVWPWWCCTRGDFAADEPSGNCQTLSLLVKEVARLRRRWVPHSGQSAVPTVCYRGGFGVAVLVAFESVMVLFRALRLRCRRHSLEDYSSVEGPKCCFYAPRDG